MLAPWSVLVLALCVISTIAAPSGFHLGSLIRGKRPSPFESSSSQPNKRPRPDPPGSPPRDRRQKTSAMVAVTCGRNRYSPVQLQAATSEGCRLNAAGRAVGNNAYPHRFNNREGLTFSAGGPFQEFPILPGGRLFTGRAPGPDRIVFNPNLGGTCTFVGAITHTGASGNNFVLCSISKSRPTNSPSTSGASSSRRQGSPRASFGRHGRF